MKRKIRTVQDVVDAMGGTGKTADYLEIVDSAVSNMKREGEIPRSYHRRLSAQLTARGYELDEFALGWLLPGDDCWPPDSGAAA